MRWEEAFQVVVFCLLVIGVGVFLVLMLSSMFWWTVAVIGAIGGFVLAVVAVKLLLDLWDV